MQDATIESLSFPSVPPGRGGSAASAALADPLTEVLRRGAQRLLREAVEAEVAAWIDERTDVVDARGRRQVVRNGSAAPRTVVTGLGPLEVTLPRVHDRRPPPRKCGNDSSRRFCRRTCARPGASKN